MNKVKKIITFILLIFSIATLAKVLIDVSLSKSNYKHKNNTLPIPQKGKFIMVYYLIMGKKRCRTCLTMEALTKKTVHKNFSSKELKKSIGFKVVDTEKKENNWYKKEFSLPSTSVIVAEYEDGNLKRFKNLNKIWFLWKNEKKYISYITKEVNKWLNGQ